MFANPIPLVILFPTRVPHLFTLSLFAVTAFAAEECPPRYSYCGYSGPAQWPNIAIEKNECGGERQSPINLVSQRPTPGPTIHVEYLAGNATILNTGHDIEVTPAGDAGKITIGDNGKVYKLVKFHFHVPSEHHIDGAEKPAEMHIVHQRVEGGKTYTAVIGVILTKGNEYPALNPVFAHLPTDVCDKIENVRIDFTKLLPKPLGAYYTYSGSLTTPPCTLDVTWYVLGAAQTILQSNWEKLHALGVNARPIRVDQPPLPVTFVRPE